MRAIMVMYDSLNRNYLPNYGGAACMPAFERLGEHSVTFWNNYAGSLPCMPARRELHTGRYNFLHREWGPLEPFDDSMPELLKKAGVYTHLISDHCHYWEDGGATYHTRYSSWQNVRGQEGDHWIPGPGRQSGNEHRLPSPKGGAPGTGPQDSINREYILKRGEFPQEETFRLGMEFLEQNHDQDQWFLQIETFDPHEPFFAPERHQKAQGCESSPYDWPSYGPAYDGEEVVEGIRKKYRSLMGLCDECLGKILDLMDRYQMWEDTMLIVNTDHGFLLGERQWWGKNIMPLYNEIVRTPLFIWDPRCGKSGERREALVQTIDLAPTLLDFFRVEIPKDMQGKSLKDTIAADSPVREYALYGNFGAHVNITDGTWYYMRGPKDAENKPLYCYTQLPLNLMGRMPVQNLRKAELAEPFPFTKGTPLLKFPVEDFFNRVMPKYRFGNRLLKLGADGRTQENMENGEKEAELLNAMVRLMQENDAPKEQYQRLGLVPDGEITPKMVQKEKQERKEAIAAPCLRDLCWEERAIWEFSKIFQICGGRETLEGLTGRLERIAAEGSGQSVTETEILCLIREVFSEEEYADAVLNVLWEGKIE